MPLMKSTHDCKQDISNKIVSSVICTESHVFRPFSRETSGASTLITYKLVFNRQTNGVQRSTGTAYLHRTVRLRYCEFRLLVIYTTLC